jgi:hypothetical protein
MLRVIEIMSKKEVHALKIHRGFIGVSYTALCVGKRVYQEHGPRTWRAYEERSSRVYDLFSANGRKGLRAWSRWLCGGCPRQGEGE